MTVQRHPETLAAASKGGQAKGRTAANFAKVQADVGFLQEKIALIQSHRNPNRAVLQTYQTMLARREAALAMLLRDKVADVLPPQHDRLGS